jgi:NAD(P)-dependent dehydrogenase (short-subunit alcohol dehydrogenase family)
MIGGSPTVSKSANALVAVALDAIGAQHGVRAFAVHPGGIITDLVRHMSPEELRAKKEFSAVSTRAVWKDRLFQHNGPKAAMPTSRNPGLLKATYDSEGRTAGVDEHHSVRLECHFLDQRPE